MAKVKTLREKLFGAAVLKLSFHLRGAADSPAFRGIYPGVLRDLGLTDADVEAFIAEHRAEIERAARGTPGDDDADA